MDSKPHYACFLKKKTKRKNNEFPVSNLRSLTIIFALARFYRRFLRMNKLFFISILLLFLQSCQVVEGIYKFGFWTGAFLVIAFVILVFYLLNKGKKGGAKPN